MRIHRSETERTAGLLPRSIDRGRHRVLFGDGDPGDLREALRAYQNADGGFGNAIEPDLRMPSSSPLATTVGIQYLVDAGGTADWPEVARAMGYLVGSFDPDLPGWDPVGPDVDDHPRAPWWTYPGSPEGFEANPGAEIAAAFLRWPGLVPSPIMSTVLDQLERRLRHPEQIDVHEFLCWARLHDVAHGDLRSAIVGAGRAAAEQWLVLDPVRWADYVPGPLWIAPTPDSPWATDVADSIDAHLDALLGLRGDDGLWHPPWTWGDDPQWPLAAAEWTGPLTIQAFASLEAWGRIDD